MLGRVLHLRDLAPLWVGARKLPHPARLYAGTPLGMSFMMPRLPRQLISSASSGTTASFRCFVTAVVFSTAPLIASCDATGVTTLRPDPNATDTDAPVLKVRVLVDTVDHDALNGLGWSEGVPNALVHFLRISSYEDQWDSVRTDDSGVARIERPEEGLYWVAAERMLTPDEVGRLEIVPRSAGVLAGGEKIRVSRGGSAVLKVPVRLDRPGSIVISEAYLSLPPPWETGDRAIYGGIYIELFNNSADVQYLDGMVFGSAYYYWRDSGAYGHHTCAATDAVRSDPAAVWSNVAWQFPGDGSQHPIHPGQAVLVAVRAQDHSVIHPDLLDLSRADFEIEYPGAADNPGAPDLRHLGPSAHGATVGFGLRLNAASFFLSSAVDVSRLPVIQDPGTAIEERPYRGYPNDKILDATAVWWDSSGLNVTRLPYCFDPLFPGRDRIPGSFLREGETTISAQRRALPLLDGTGWVRLDTNTSRVDFVRAERTPGG